MSPILLCHCFLPRQLLVYPSRSSCFPHLRDVAVDHFMSVIVKQVWQRVVLYFICWDFNCCAGFTQMLFEGLASFPYGVVGDEVRMASGCNDISSLTRFITILTDIIYHVMLHTATSPTKYSSICVWIHGWGNLSWQLFLKLGNHESSDTKLQKRCNGSHYLPTNTYLP